LFWNGAAFAQASYKLLSRRACEVFEIVQLARNCRKLCLRDQNAGRAGGGAQIFCAVRFKSDA
jgi:hypothetical protein